MGTQKLKRVPIAEVPKWGPMWEQWQSDQLLFNDVDQNPKNFVADFSTSRKKAQHSIEDQFCNEHHYYFDGH